METQKQKWFKPGVKSHHIGCLCCGGNEQVLPINTSLYFEYGGWIIRKNDIGYYQAPNNGEPKTIEDIEEEITDNNDCWEAVLYLPLRGGTWQRHGPHRWILVEENEGFA